MERRVVAALCAVGCVAGMSLVNPKDRARPPQEQRLMVAAEPGRPAEAAVARLGNGARDQLERLAGAEAFHEAAELRRLYALAARDWEAAGAGPDETAGRAWFGRRVERDAERDEAARSVRTFSDSLGLWLARAGYVEVDARERALCDALARDAGLRVDVDDRPLREMRCWRRGVQGFEEPLSLADTLEYVLSESVERTWRRCANIARNALDAAASRRRPSNTTVTAEAPEPPLYRRRARRAATFPLRATGRGLRKVSRQLLSRWGAGRALDDDECDVAAFAVEGRCVAGAVSPAPPASEPALGWVELPRRGVGAAVDAALANATSLWGAVAALATPPPRRCVVYARVVALHATAPERTRPLAKRTLGLALYEDVPLRTLGTLWPTRRLRVRPLDAVRFDVVTGATFVLLLAAQRLGTVWGDVAASVAVFAWVSRLLFATKARRNMYELETTRALRDRVRAKGAAVCDAIERDAVEADAMSAALCLGAVRKLSWGEYDDATEQRLRAELLTQCALDAGDPDRAAAAADEALRRLPDLAERGLIVRRGDGWRARPRPDADASLADAWLAAYVDGEGAAETDGGSQAASQKLVVPSTVNEVISYPFLDRGEA